MTSAYGGGGQMHGGTRIRLSLALFSSLAHANVFCNAVAVYDFEFCHYSRLQCYLVLIFCKQSDSFSTKRRCIVEQQSPNLGGSLGRRQSRPNEHIRVWLSQWSDGRLRLGWRCRGPRGGRWQGGPKRCFHLYTFCLIRHPCALMKVVWWML